MRTALCPRQGVHNRAVIAAADLLLGPWDAVTSSTRQYQLNKMNVFQALTALRCQKWLQL